MICRPRTESGYPKLGPQFRWKFHLARSDGKTVSIARFNTVIALKADSQIEAYSDPSQNSCSGSEKVCCLWGEKVKTDEISVVIEERLSRR